MGISRLLWTTKKANTLNGERKALGQILRPFLVVIAPDDVQRCKALQRIHNGLGVDVAAVDNRIRVGEAVQHLRSKQAMGVREDDDALHIKFPRNFCRYFPQQRIYGIL